MKSSILWDMTSYTPVKANRRFGGICRLNLESRRIIQARNQNEADSKQGRWYFPPKRPSIFAELHSVISQKIKLFNVIYDFNFSMDILLLYRITVMLTLCTCSHLPS
jgi:hypothetical protein